MILLSLGRRMKLSKFCPTAYETSGIRLKALKYTYASLLGSELGNGMRILEGAHLDLFRVKILRRRPRLRQTFRQKIEPVLAKTVHLKDADATRNLGRLIGQNVKAGLVIALLGDLGAGKTTLTQALATALGIQEPVSSPTFLMLSEYHSGRFPLFHFDLYRMQEDMQSPSALFQMKSDLEEALMSNSVVVVEWLNLWEEFAADCDQLRIELRYISGSEGRDAILSASGPGAQGLLDNVSADCHVES